MSYRCSKCDLAVPPGISQLKEVVYRTNGSILREIPVCPTCYSGQKPTPSDDSSTPGRVVGVLEGENVQIQLKIPMDLQPRSKKPTPKEKPVERLVIEPRCDVCSEPVGEDGQVTEEGLRCVQHLPTKKSPKSPKSPKRKK